MNFKFTVSSRYKNWQGGQRMEPSLTLSVAGPLLNTPLRAQLNFQVPMRNEIILHVICHRLLKAELGTAISRRF